MPKYLFLLGVVVFILKSSIAIIDFPFSRPTGRYFPLPIETLLSLAVEEVKRRKEVIFVGFPRRLIGLSDSL
jgi:hypothetical protein